MDRKAVLIPDFEMERQREIEIKIRAMNAALSKTPLAFVDTYGCQQNVADSERIRGMLEQMGYEFTQDTKQADIIVINTCAIREHAEQRVLGNVGALVHTKRANPNQVIVLCGCMVQQEQVAEKIRRSFRHVDLVFGPHALWRFPELLYQILNQRGRIIEIRDCDGTIAEGLPISREGRIKAWVSIMYGCNNFCSYCIVPYVRGRERSRDPELILSEIRELAAEGYKDITLLGQNVNSYGKDLDTKIDFSSILERINEVPGDFLIRFMTSHPKDASPRLFEIMAKCEKVAKHLHLPFQAGNNRVLGAMNRGYTQEGYLELVEQAKHTVPNLVLTSDIIVGFPGETDEEFEDTLKVLRRVEFDALFTFIYSPRTGTPAALLPDPFTKGQKQEHFEKLLNLQNEVSARKHAAYKGTTVRVLVDGLSGDERFNLTARTNGGRLVHLCGDAGCIGTFVDVEITENSTWALFGKV